MSNYPQGDAYLYVIFEGLVWDVRIWNGVEEKRERIWPKEED